MKNYYVVQVEQKLQEGPLPLHQLSPVFLSLLFATYPCPKLCFPLFLLWNAGEYMYLYMWKSV